MAVSSLCDSFTTRNFNNNHKTMINIQIMTPGSRPFTTNLHCLLTSRRTELDIRGLLVPVAIATGMGGKANMAAGESV